MLKVVQPGTTGGRARPGDVLVLVEVLADEPGVVAGLLEPHVERALGVAVGVEGGPAAERFDVALVGRVGADAGLVRVLAGEEARPRHAAQRVDDERVRSSDAPAFRIRCTERIVCTRSIEKSSIITTTMLGCAARDAAGASSAASDALLVTRCGAASSGADLPVPPVAPQAISAKQAHACPRSLEDPHCSPVVSRAGYKGDVARHRFVACHAELMSTRSLDFSRRAQTRRSRTAEWSRS